MGLFDDEGAFILERYILSSRRPLLDQLMNVAIDSLHTHQNPSVENFISSGSQDYKNSAEALVLWIVHVSFMSHAISWLFLTLYINMLYCIW